MKIRDCRNDADAHTSVSLSLTLLIIIIIMSDSSTAAAQKDMKLRTDWLVFVCVVLRWMRLMAFGCGARACPSVCVWVHRMRVHGIHAFEVIRNYLSCVFPLRWPFEWIMNVVKLLECHINTNTFTINSLSIEYRQGDRFSDNRCLAGW